MDTVRRPAVAGTFYPADPQELRRVLRDHLEQARAHTPTGAAVPKAVIVPHAGYVYSGPVAARAYARLEAARAQTTRAVVLGPAHRVPLAGIALPGADRLATPLGELAVDPGGCATALSCPEVVVDRGAHAREHSIEVQLPFLQVVLGEVSVVPLVVGSAPAAVVAQVVAALWGGAETVIVVSSDLSHYLPDDLARRVDAATLTQVQALDPSITHDQACGASPLNGMLLAAHRRGMRVEVLGRCTSADTAGSPDSVVGYCAVALHEQPVDTGTQTSPPTPQEGAQVPAEAGETLLPLAREAINRALAREPQAQPPPPATLLEQARLETGLPAWATRPGASFVTLRNPDGSLRGCIGSLEAHRPLAQDVVDNAVAAATQDLRFAPVGPEEMASLRLEVSVLSPPRRVPASSEQQVRDQLRPGVDGVVLRLGSRRATFLPQVWEELADPAAFLSHLKRKAGWSPDFWDADMQVSTYQVDSWEEP